MQTLESKSAQAVESLKQWGLDWNVEKTSLSYEFNGEKRESHLSALIHSKSGSVLGTVGDQYHVTQNHEILKCMQGIAKTHDLKITKAGQFKGGKRVFFQLELPEQIKVGPDKVTKYIFAASSHDGRGSLWLGFQNEVMSCANQFNRFMKNMDFKFRHTPSIEEKIKDVETMVHAYFAHESKLYGTYGQMADTSVNKHLVNDLVNYLINTDRLPIEDLSSIKLNQINDMNVAIKSEMNNKGETMWGLFNGVTYYANHLKKYPRIGSKAEGLLDKSGSGYILMNRSLEFLEQELITQ